jgi:hypothetical protein
VIVVVVVVVLVFCGGSGGCFTYRSIPIYETASLNNLKLNQDH